MKKNYKPRKAINIILIGITIIGIILIFTPWLYSRGSVYGSYGGSSMSSSANSSSLIGLLTWGGFICLLLLVFELIILLKKKVKPGIISYLSPILLVIVFIVYGIATDDSSGGSSSMSSYGAYGSASLKYKVDWGYIAFGFAAFTLLIFTFFRRKRIKEISAESNAT